MNPIHTCNPRIHPTWSMIREDYLADAEVQKAYLAMGRSMRGDHCAPLEYPVPPEESV